MIETNEKGSEEAARVIPVHIVIDTQHCHHETDTVLNTFLGAAVQATIAIVHLNLFFPFRIAFADIVNVKLEVRMVTHKNFTFRRHQKVPPEFEAGVQKSIQ
ncbi:hypothetical protein EV421DRAFT_1743808 [Armillaria borealis]|uniref:Uncharacterized protein n=1 Tax=Armillaria borealis TaxID=47425 RepID=A0AA39IWX1_9AGAR|nr:hypothetical protein EV421DRAFT_1743808 [Armillaria borealis]